MDANVTGVAFNNDLPYTEDYNTYTYRNFYNGGGIALGDINNDGLIDIYLTGNIVDNKLFLNKGNWTFEDITVASGTACHDVWSTGANFVDINGDGLLDIYVCKAGKPGGANRHNELFINRGDLTFKESAHEYGLDVTGLSIQSAFFDYDRDGDLDCYLLNNSLRSVGGFDYKEGQRNIPDPDGNKFFRNDNGHFSDIAQEAGIYSSHIGYGLGITLSDFNQDDWTDIFISNDFFERDYLYLNNQDGTFREVGDTYFGSMSMGSMGADACDIDNDLLPDLFVTEMLPNGHERRHTKTQYESWDKYEKSIKSGYHHQFSRNVLQKNVGGNHFLEVGRFAGVAATEWSWASLVQDYDNDGLKDLFVSNGIYKDLLDKDYLNFSADATMIKSKIDNKENVLTMLVDSMPSIPIKNCMFKNINGQQFELVSDSWGLDQLTFSNGSAYADLDNDGDLDLVVNNANMPAYLYKNNLDTATNKSLHIKLVGKDKNTSAIGAKVTAIHTKGKVFIENYTSKGFESCMDGSLHLGLGSVDVIDTLKVTWPDGQKSELYAILPNQRLIIDQKQIPMTPTAPIVRSFSTGCGESILPFKHQDIDLNLFTRERLLVEMNGFDGPAIAVGDVNNDGRDDVFCGGGKNQPSILFVSNGLSYTQVNTPFDVDYRSEAVNASFFDSDNDGDLDLYVAHGGINFSVYAPELHDVLYVNDGKGNFAKSTASLPFPYPIYTGDMAIVDINKDGLKDIIVVEKMKTNLFGLPGSGMILVNKGKNVFEYVMPDALKNLGMITSVVATDIDSDGYPDIILAGKWMPINKIMNNKGSFETSKVEAMDATSGLWNTLESIDFDGDGDDDIIAGNIGLNSFYTPKMRMFVADFDGNGSSEQIICERVGDQYFPIHDIDDMFSQMPFLKKKFLSYQKCAKADMATLFGAELLKSAQITDIVELASIILVNEGGGKYHKVLLPNEAQYSSIHAVHAIDISPNQCDIYFGGNDDKVKPQFGRQDASLGWKLTIYKDDIQNPFGRITPLYVKGPIRQIKQLDDKIILGINNQNIKICNINEL